MKKSYNYIFSLLLLLYTLSCQVKKHKEEVLLVDNQDTTVVIDQVNATGQEDELETISNLSGIDSILYFIINKKSRQPGEFAQAFVITDRMVEIEEHSYSIIAVLLQTGTGIYGGIQHEAFPYETLYSTLALIKVENDVYTLLDYLKLPESGGQGLYYDELYCEPVEVANDGEAIVLYELESEEGAGDSGYKYHTARIFISNNGKLAEVLSYPVSHFTFSSDESENYNEVFIETMFTTQVSKSKLMDIFLSSNERYNDEQYAAFDFKGGDELYTWNGKKYVKSLD